MRLVPISSETLINPDHISHITMRAEPAPENGGQFAHDYPIYRITMYDGKWFDIAFKNDYPRDDNYSFEPLRYVLQTLGMTS